VFEDVTFALGHVNEALARLDNRRGGFSNFVITP
jgi:alcohol dehydrogenase